MSGHDWNPWQQDRQDAAAGRQRLVVEKHGHQVVVDHQGLAIDGERVCRTPLTGEQAVRGTADPQQSRAFQVTPAGAVVYRGRVVAELAPPPPGTANPGTVTVHGPGGPPWQPGTDLPPPQATPAPAAQVQQDLADLSAAQRAVEQARQAEEEHRRRRREEEVRRRRDREHHHERTRTHSREREMEIHR